jgi:excisionase family DNA binding protein
MPYTKKEYFTVKDVAKELGVTYITALGYIKKGLMEGIRVGGQWRISLEELERFKREGNLQRGRNYE